jgi:putative membrane protein
VLKIVVPLGVGVVAGVAGVSNLVKWALREHPKFTLGVLLGFLAGAVPGIWPFQEGVAPAADHRHFDSPEKWSLRYFDPTVAQIAMALGLIAVGLFLTLLIDRFGKDKK